MADKQVRIHLSETGAEQTAAAIGRVDGAMSGLARQALAAGAAYFSATGVVQGLKYSVSQAVDAEAALKKLTTAYKGNTEGLERYAAAIQRKTRFDDDAAVAAMASISAFVKEEKSIKQLTAAAADFAEAKGIDLVSAAELLAKTVGSEANALGRYGVKVDAAVGSSERLRQVTEGVARLYGGQAAAAVDTLSGRLAQSQNAVDNAAQSLGETLTPVITWAAGEVQSLAETWEDLIKGFQDARPSSVDELKAKIAGLAKEMDAISFKTNRPIEFMNWVRQADLDLLTETAKLFRAQGLAADANKITSYVVAFKDLIAEQDRLAALAKKTGGEIPNVPTSKDIKATEDLLAIEMKRLQVLYEMSTFGEEEHLARLARNDEQMQAAYDLYLADEQWLDAKAAEDERRADKDVRRQRARRNAYLDFAAASVSGIAAVNEAMRGSKDVTLALMKAEGRIMAIKAGINTVEEMSNYLPFPLPEIMGASVAAAQLAQVAKMGGYATGGYITGHGGTRSDTIPAMLSAGEGVLNASAVARIGGEAAIHALNNGRRVTNDGVQIHFHGPITDREFVRDFIAPEIRKAVSRA